MTELPRLLTDGTPEERQLMHAARAYRPTEDVHGRLVTALGLTTVTAIGSATGVASGAVATGAGSAGGAASGSAAGATMAKTGALLLSTKKLVLVGAVVSAGAVSTGLYHFATAPSAPDANSAAPNNTAIHVTPTPNEADETPTTEPASEASIEAVPTPAPSVPAPMVPKPTPRAAGSAESGISAELDVLDRAKRALSSGAPGRALALLDEYQRRFAKPTLGLEAEVLRIRALHAAGQTDRARQLARAFVKRHPRSLHAQRLTKIAELDAEPKSNATDGEKR